MTTATTEPNAMKLAKGNSELTAAVRRAAAASVALGRKLGTIATSAKDKMIQDAADQFTKHIPRRLGCRPSATEIADELRKLAHLDDGKTQGSALARLQAGQEIEARLQIATWDAELSKDDEQAMEKAMECLMDGCFELEFLHSFASKDEVFDRILAE